MCENGNLFRFFRDFPDSVIAIKLRTHVHIRQADPHVSMYVLLLCDQRGLGLSDIMFWYSYEDLFQCFRDFLWPVPLRASGLRDALLAGTYSHFCLQV